MKSISRDKVLQQLKICGESGVPLHMQLRAGLRQTIQDHFADGESFWTETALAETLKISRGTVRQALAELSREGLLERKAAVGTVVRKAAQGKSLGVFVPQYDSDFFNGVLEQLGTASAERGVRMRVYYTYREATIQALLEQVEGAPLTEEIVLLGTGNVTAVLHNALEKRGYATVAIDSLPPRFMGRYVGTDNAAGVRLGLEHLWEQGHRSIALLVNEPDDVLSVQERVRAFQQFMAKCDGDGRVVVCHTPAWNDSFEAAYAHMAELWQPPYPTAVFTVSDPGAWAALKWFSRHGVAVPEQVSVLGFEGVRQSRFTDPALTTVAHPMQALARRALEALGEPAAGRDLLPPSLELRESTAPVHALSAAESRAGRARAAKKVATAA